MDTLDDVAEADHAQVLFEYMRNMFDEGRLCDVSVHCDGELIARLAQWLAVTFSYPQVVGSILTVW